MLLIRMNPLGFTLDVFMSLFNFQRATYRARKKPLVSGHASTTNVGLRAPLFSANSEHHM